MCFFGKVFYLFNLVTPVMFLVKNDQPIKNSLYISCYAISSPKSIFLSTSTSINFQVRHNEQCMSYFFSKLVNTKGE